MKDISLVIGSTLLIGVTVLDNADQLLEKIQIFGTVYDINSKNLTILINGSKRKYTVPTNLNNIEKTRPGQLKLKTSDMTIEPEFTSNWTISLSSNEQLNLVKSRGFSAKQA